MGFTDPTSLRVGNADGDDVTVGLEGTDKGEDVWGRVCGGRTIVVGELGGIRQLALAEQIVRAWCISPSPSICGVGLLCAYEDVHDVRCLLITVVIQELLCFGGGRNAG